MIGNPNIALVVLMLGVLGIYAGLCGRIVVGVVGGVAALVGLASLTAAHTHFDWRVAVATCVPLAGVSAWLLAVVRRGRKNKTV